MKKIKTSTPSGITVTLHVDRKCVTAEFIHPKTNEKIEFPCRWNTANNCLGVGTIAVKIPREVWNEAETIHKELKYAFHRENLSLVEEDHLGNIFHVHGYSLSARVNSQDWAKIKHLFDYADMTNNDHMLHGYRFKGWIVKKENAAAVEELLNIKPENRIEIREAAAEEKAAKDSIEKEQEKALQREIREAFETAKPVKPVADKKITVKGEQYGPGPTAYGGGWWYVIQPDRIWLVENNGADGDMWSLNNVETGGAGAIGRYIPYDRTIAEKIKQL